MNMDTAWATFLLTWIGVFSGLEGYALFTGNTTLSAYVRALGTKWPWLPYAYVILAGVLAIHFWVQARKG